MAIMVRLWYVISVVVIVGTVARDYSANYLCLRVDGEFLCIFRIFENTIKQRNVDNCLVY